MTPDQLVRLVAMLIELDGLKTQAYQQALAAVTAERDAALVTLKGYTPDP